MRARIFSALVLAVSLAACASSDTGADAGAGGANGASAGGAGGAGGYANRAAPGSEEDLVQTVGDRIFFATDTEHVERRCARHARPAGRLAAALSVGEGRHRRQLRRARHRRVQPRAWPAACQCGPRISRRARHQPGAHPVDQLRQGPADRSGVDAGSLGEEPQRHHHGAVTSFPPPASGRAKPFSGSRCPHAPCRGTPSTTSTCRPGSPAAKTACRPAGRPGSKGRTPPATR